MFTLQDAASFLRNQRVNVQFEFVLTEEGDTLFNARATYWRGSEHSDRMYLVAEHTPDEAIIALASAMEDRAWHRVDWRARLYKRGVYGVRILPDTMINNMEGRDKARDDHYPYTRS